MSLANIAPTEKAEHLIYTILPIAVGLWLASMYTEDLFEALAYIGLASSLLTMFLYELRLDEIIVKAWYGRDWGRRSRQIEKSFLSWNLLFDTWEEAVLDPPDFRNSVGDLKWQVKNFTKSAVSSYSIKKRLWPIRGSLYLFIAFPLLIWVGLFNIVKFGLQFTIPILGISLVANESNIFASALILTILFWIIQVSFNLHRHKSLRSHIQQLVIFRYVQRLLAYDSLAKPEIYGSSGNQMLINLSSELGFLDRIIAQDDWPTFVERFKPIRWNNELKARDQFYLGVTSNLLRLWKDHCIRSPQGRRKRMEIITSARKLGWCIYYTQAYAKRTRRELGPHSTGIIQLVSTLFLADTTLRTQNTTSQIGKLAHWLGRTDADEEEVSIRLPSSQRMLYRLANPILAFSKTPDFLLDDRPKADEPEMECFSCYLLEKILDFYSGKVSEETLQQIRKMMENEDTVNSEVIGRQITKIVRECFARNERTSIWRDLTYTEQEILLEELFDKISKWDDGSEFSYILAQFLFEASVDSRISVLRSNLWKNQMNSEPVQEVLKRMKNRGKALSSKLLDAITALPSMQET